MLLWKQIILSQHLLCLLDHQKALNLSYEINYDAIDAT